MRIISGGQTGVDRMGLEVGYKLGLKTGGTAPKGYRTEVGRDPSLSDFGLVEDDSSEYSPRTRKNVLAADGTVLFGDMLSSGSLETVKVCRAFCRPHIENPSVAQLVAWLYEHKVEVLNVAGNRGSRINKERLHGAELTLTAALEQYLNSDKRPHIYVR